MRTGHGVCGGLIRHGKLIYNYNPLFGVGLEIHMRIGEEILFSYLVGGSLGGIILGSIT